jgi:2-oxoglutarate dehydrogenase E2 component (dihydrolipoamide succinyltransferase)
MNIKFEFNTDSITQTEHYALVAFLRGLAVRQPVNVLDHVEITPGPVKAFAPPVENFFMAPTSAAHAASARELEQLATEVADTQSPAAPAPAAYTPPTDLAAIFGGAPAGGKPVWPFAGDEAEQPAGPASPAAPAPAVTAVQLDKNGLPWDARIHASSKAINADGSWRAKKMVDAAVVASVEAELRATMGAPAAPAAQPAAPAPTPLPAQPAPDASALLPAQPASPVAAPTPAPAAPTPAPAAPTPAPAAPATPAAPGNPDTDLPTFLKEATTLINAGRATTADMIAAANSAGIPHPGALTQRPDLIATVRAAFLAKVAPVAAA